MNKLAARNYPLKHLAARVLRRNAPPDGLEAILADALARQEEAEKALAGILHREAA